MFLTSILTILTMLFYNLLSSLLHTCTWYILLICRMSFIKHPLTPSIMEKNMGWTNSVIFLWDITWCKYESVRSIKYLPIWYLAEISWWFFFFLKKSANEWNSSIFCTFYGFYQVIQYRQTNQTCLQLYRVNQITYSILKNIQHI